MNVDQTHAGETERLKRKNWIQTFTGRKFTPLDAHPEDVCIEDIAHALAQKCRYTGHVREFYSVAQHSVLVSGLLPPSFKLAGLLHDATEAYLPDVAAPIKRSVCFADGRTFGQVEDALATVIFQALGLASIRPLIDSEEVKRVDLILLSTEVRDLMGEPPDDWGLTHEANAVAVSPWSPDLAEDRFLEEFYRLVRP